MAESNIGRKELINEIMNRKNLGDKKFHSETSLQQFGEDEEASNSDSYRDPGVLNEPLHSPSATEQTAARRRTMSQPGPVSGNFVTASAARAARNRSKQRSVAYADDLGRNESADRQLPKLIPSNKGDDSGSATPIGDRGSPTPYNGNYRNGDIKSLNSYRIYTPVSESRGGATPRKRSVATMDAQSIRSVETHAPPSTSPKDNKRLTMEYLTLIMSCTYGILLVTLGIVIFLSEPFIEERVSPIYSIILTALGFLYHIYLVTDINRYKSKALKNQKTKALHEEKIAEYFRKQEEEDSYNGDRTPENYKPPMVQPLILIPLKHNYCFSQGRHSGSFYLKLGAAAFALGHLVHSVLLIAVQVGHFLDDEVDNDECAEVLRIILDLFNPIYCFFQLYFIFKYSNVIILRAKGLARFGFMHMIGSSLCFWISAIVRETVLALTLYANSQNGGDGYGNQTETSFITNTEFVVQDRFFDVSNLYSEQCTGSQAISSIFENFSPYLYPFTVEFNILIVAVYYIIWSNIGNCESLENNALTNDMNSTSEENYTICKIPTASEENDFTSNIVIYADCHASNRGLFLGLILMVFVVGMLIIGFVFSTVGQDFLEIGYILNDSTKLALHIAMLFGVVIAYNQTRKLDINEHPISLLDDILLFICLPAFFMETVFSMVATISILNVVKTTDVCVMVIQVVIQTSLLVDGLRRCSNSKKLRRKKPGREVLMFLLIANVGMWIFNTFSYKSPESLDERYAYYGKVLWTILGHISLPLIMFYRFHSSVCFADIWNSAYKPGLEH